MDSKYKVEDKVIFSYNGYENEQGVITRVIETYLDDEPYWYDVSFSEGSLCLREEYIIKVI